MLARIRPDVVPADAVTTYRAAGGVNAADAAEARIAQMLAAAAAALSATARGRMAAPPRLSDTLRARGKAGLAGR